MHSRNYAYHIIMRKLKNKLICVNYKLIRISHVYISYINKGVHEVTIKKRKEREKKRDCAVFIDIKNLFLIMCACLCVHSRTVDSIYKIPKDILF